jgi:transcriptional regulator with XRE-family HTH domain
MPRDTSPTGGLLVDARTRAGLSARALAEKADVPASEIALIESGESDPSVGTLSTLVAACGMELRMWAAEINPGDEAQLRTDASISADQAWETARRLRAQVVSIRPFNEE